MNREGIRPESLCSEPEPKKPEFVTAVGDDSISRFDRPRKQGRGNKGRGKNKNRRPEGGKGGKKPAKDA